MRILIIEDEHRIAQAIKKGLEQETYAVDIAYSSTEGFDLATTEEYDAIILDLMLPEMDGLTLCQKLREEKIHTPILMLTAKDQLSDRVAGLNCGADDYLVKPFAFEELLARLRAILRRPSKMIPNVLNIEDLTVDSAKFTVTRANQEIHLSQKEFSLLQYLLSHPYQILSKNKIITHVWNYDADILPNTVEATIRNLRKKIDQPFANRSPLIHTVRGYGYKIGQKKGES
jgi:DNA-binding response OmpR family regulator